LLIILSNGAFYILQGVIFFMKILYVEDEKIAAEAIVEILRKQNYNVDLVFNGQDGLDFALTGLYDVVILDIMLPKLDGISVLKKIRKANIAVPVILLTAKSETSDKVLGLDSGADDYLPKPFEIDELLARLRALGRRRGELAQDNRLRYGDIELNPQALDVFCYDKSYRLTSKESQLLELLILNKNATLTSEIITDRIWGYDAEAEYNQVQVYISFLRKKLTALDSNVKIQTVRGVGYTLTEE
jgi:two-component system, OmpR family, response regulator ArlR